MDYDIVHVYYVATFEMIETTKSVKIKVSWVREHLLHSINDRGAMQTHAWQYGIVELIFKAQKTQVKGRRYDRFRC